MTTNQTPAVKKVKSKKYFANAMAWLVSYADGTRDVVPNNKEPNTAWLCWNASVTAQEAKQ